MIFVAT